jgi:hypothetical protein
MLETILGSSVAKKFIEFLGQMLASKWKDRKQSRDLLDLHKRRIMAARVTNSIYRELHGFRDAFLQHGLADRNDANRKFFDKWLSDPVVELGWTPSGGWTRRRISALHADLEAL